MDSKGKCVLGHIPGSTFGITLGADIAPMLHPLGRSKRGRPNQVLGIFSSWSPIETEARNTTLPRSMAFSRFVPTDALDTPKLSLCCKLFEHDAGFNLVLIIYQCRLFRL